MMTTGSVRGKCSVLHDGQSRRQPACVIAVAAPQFEQKPCLRCQPRSALASASGGRCSFATAPWTAMLRRSMIFRSGREPSELDGCCAERARKPRLIAEKTKKDGLARLTKRVRFGGRKQRIEVFAVALEQHRISRRTGKSRRVSSRQGSQAWHDRRAKQLRARWGFRHKQSVAACRARSVWTRRSNVPMHGELTRQRQRARRFAGAGEMELCLYHRSSSRRCKRIEAAPEGVVKRCNALFIPTPPVPLPRSAQAWRADPLH